MGRERRWRTTGEVVGAVVRLLRALGERDFDEGEETTLGAFRTLREALDGALARAVERSRAAGMTDGEIGEALGISRQAVSKHWSSDGRYRGAAGRYRRWPGKDRDAQDGPGDGGRGGDEQE